MNGIPTPIPGERAMEITVMRYMGGWSQGDYDSADANLIDEITARAAAEGHWQAERAMKGRS